MVFMLARIRQNYLWTRTISGLREVFLNIVSSVCLKYCLCCLCRRLPLNLNNLGLPSRADVLAELHSPGELDSKANGAALEVCLTL